MLILSANAFSITPPDQELKSLADVFDDVLKDMGISGETIDFPQSEKEPKINKEKRKLPILEICDTLSCFKLEYYWRAKSWQKFRETAKPDFEEWEAIDAKRPFDISILEKERGILLKREQRPSVPHINAEVYWERKYKETPQLMGIIRMSRVYIDKQGLIGIFFAAHSCGPLCGQYNLYCISKSDGKWRIEKVIRMGMS